MRETSGVEGGEGGSGSEGSRVYLTQVRTQYRAEKRNYRVLFGEPECIETLREWEGHGDKVYRFAQGARFALDLWARNAYGTTHWRCFVCEAIGPGMQGMTVPFVNPAVRVLIHTKGAAQSRLFLQWLLMLEASSVNLLRCPRETFEAAHFRLQGSRADRTPPQRLSGLP
jgi:hypothetical protein